MTKLSALCWRRMTPTLSIGSHANCYLYNFQIYNQQSSARTIELSAMIIYI